MIWVISEMLGVIRSKGRSLEITKDRFSAGFDMVRKIFIISEKILTFIAKAIATGYGRLGSGTGNNKP